ncbi:MAG: hypothetical protein FWH43_02815 [Endomicrobia bacterium]|nr:hypothetical protein [Endomicrobiia bacterium]
MTKYGKTIIPYGVNPEPHEIETAQFFNKHGKDVEFLTPNRTRGVKNPDIKMDSILWEIKSPKNTSKRAIENIFRKALKQSKNIIFDLSRSRMSNDNKGVAQITKQFALVKNAHRLIIITKAKKLLDFKK